MMKRLALLALLLASPADASTIAPTTQTIVVVWDSNRTVAVGTIPLGTLPWAKGKIISCTYYTSGSSPSFTATVKIGTTAVTGCNALVVTSLTPTTSLATALNTFVAGNALSVVISAVTNAPNTAVFQINFQTTAN